jgi:hypothetical protein
MIRRQLHVVVFTCGLVAVYAQAADNGGGRIGTSANVTRGSAGPTGDILQRADPPLETGEVKVPKGGVDTSRFDPNAGEGFKGKSTSGGGTIQPRDAVSGNGNASNAGNTGATTGAPLSGTAPRATGRGNDARGERGSGKTETNSAGAKTGGGAGSAGSGSR